MDSSFILGITTFVYMSATICYVAYAVFRKDLLAKAGLVGLVAGILSNSAGIGLRWLETHQQGIGYVPLSNMYESLVFFALCIAVLYLFIEFHYKVKIFGTYIIPFAFLAMAYASYSPEFGKEIRPLLPALQSNWLISHVVTCFIGYAAFAVSCGMATFYLFKCNRKKSDHQTSRLLKTVDDINYRMIVFGFIWLTAGIVTGAIWANSAWGTYWSWDPKETWALITWLVFATYLHARITKGWEGKKTAILGGLGFFVIWICYLGVNFLGKGLHSYGWLS